MNIKIEPVRNGLLVTIDAVPSANDPMAQRQPHAGTWFALDATDAIGRISAAVQDSYPRAPDLEGTS